MNDVKKVDRRIVILIWIIGFLTVWEIGAWLLDSVLRDPMATQKLPYVHNIVIVFIQNIASLFQSGLITLSKAAVGLLIGTTVGFIAALMMSFAKPVEKIALPYLVASQMIPVLGLAPIVYSIVKDGDTARVIIAAYITFFPVAVNVLAGFNSVDKDKKDLLYSYATNGFYVYYKLMIPAALPHLFVGLKIAAPSSITAAILVEMLGTSEGIGVKMLYTLYYGANGALMFWASVMMAALLGVFSYLVICFLNKLLVPWERGMNQRGGE